MPSIENGTREEQASKLQLGLRSFTQRPPPRTQSPVSPSPVVFDIILKHHCHLSPSYSHVRHILKCSSWNLLLLLGNVGVMWQRERHNSRTPHPEQRNKELIHNCWGSVGQKPDKGS
ncbi:hypothetical protein WN943_021049 [Citrus x changshan-huyou]